MRANTTRTTLLALTAAAAFGGFAATALRDGFDHVARAEAAVAAVPADGGVLDTRVDTLVDAAEWLLRDADAARRMGARARQAVRTRYGVDRFLADWDRLLEEERCASR